MKQLLKDRVKIQEHGTCIVRIWLKYYVTYSQSRLSPTKQKNQLRKYDVTKEILIILIKMILF